MAATEIIYTDLAPTEMECYCGQKFTATVKIKRFADETATRHEEMQIRFAGESETYTLNVIRLARCPQCKVLIDYTGNPVTVVNDKNDDRESDKNN